MDDKIALLLVGAVVALVGRIVWDWLSGSKTPMVCPLDRSNVAENAKWVKDKYSE